MVIKWERCNLEEKGNPTNYEAHTIRRGLSTIALEKQGQQQKLPATYVR